MSVNICVYELWVCVYEGICACMCIYMNVCVIMCGVGWRVSCATVLQADGHARLSV